MSGISLNLLTWLLALLPILVMLAALVLLRWPAHLAAIASWVAAILLASAVFGATPYGLAIACAKGLSLSLFVLLIVWAAVFLYNLVDRLGGVQVIADHLVRATDDSLLRALLLAWGFAGFLQGIAGFGAPVAAVAPLLVMMGVSPVVAVASAMVGHSWAITFGSMGSSYYAIQLVTRLPGEVIGPWMAAMFYLPILVTGFAVLHLNAGWPGVRRGAPAVLLAGTAMSAGMVLLNLLGAAPISSMLPALAGCGLIWLLGRTGLYRRRPDPAPGSALTPTLSQAERGSGSPFPHRLGDFASGPNGPDAPEGGQGVRSGPSPLSFHLAFLPYYLLIVLTVLSQLDAVKALTAGLAFGVDYPATSTALGYQVPAERAYAKIRLVGHPAPLIALASVLSYLVYRRVSCWRPGAASGALATTARRSVKSGLTIAFMVMMAVVVNDAGMAWLLARGVQATTNGVYPALAPYLGVLGAFITGSNTNSNIMFGPLQLQTAQALGVSAILISAAQSIGGSLGAGISPDKSVIGGAVTGLAGKEDRIMRQALPYALVATLAVGIETWLLVYVAGLAP